MKRAINGLLLAFCMLLSGCVFDDEVNYADFRVSGSVYDASTRQPLAGKDVTLKSRLLGSFAATSTDAQGAFKIEAMSGGFVIDTVMVVVSDAQGYYLPDSLQVVLTPAANNGLDQMPATASVMFFMRKKD